MHSLGDGVRAVMESEKRENARAHDLIETMQLREDADARDVFLRAAAFVLAAEAVQFAGIEKTTAALTAARRYHVMMHFSDEELDRYMAGDGSRIADQFKSRL